MRLLQRNHPAPSGSYESRSAVITAHQSGDSIAIAGQLVQDFDQDSSGS